MVNRAQIQTLADQIVAKFPEVETIILFGSYARGAPTRDSDVDLLIVMDHTGAGYRAASRIRVAIDVDFPIDLIVRSSAELADRVRQGDNFMQQIDSEGAVLYEAKHGGMDREGGSGLRRKRRAAPLA